MTELNQDYITDLRQGTAEAIRRVSAGRQGGSLPGGPKALYIGNVEDCQTLTILLAEFLEPTPGLVTPGDIRQMSETIAKKAAAWNFRDQAAAHPIAWRASARHDHPMPLMEARH